METDPGERPRSEIAGEKKSQPLIYFTVLLRQTCYTFCYVTCPYRVVENHDAAARGGDGGVCMWWSVYEFLNTVIHLLSF